MAGRCEGRRGIKDSSEPGDLGGHPILKGYSGQKGSHWPQVSVEPQKCGQSQLCGAVSVARIPSSKSKYQKKNVNYPIHDVACGLRVEIVWIYYRVK